MHIFINSQLIHASITSPTFPPYVAKQLTAVPHTTTLQLLWILKHSTSDILHILVKAQASTQSSWPQSPTRLGIRDLGLLNKFGHCGLSAASRHKLAFTRRHYALLTAIDTTALYLR